MTEFLVLREVGLSWVPTLRYYQHRLDPVAALEDLDEVVAFQVLENLINVRLQDADLSFGSRGLTVACGPGSAEDAPLRLIRLILESVEPRQYGDFRVRTHHFVPIPTESDFAQACVEGTSQVSGGVLPKLGIDDFATLADGSSEDVKWQCEFGIVSPEQAQERLQLGIGRLNKSEGKSTPPTYREQKLPLDRLGPVNLWVETRWTGLKRLRDQPALDWAGSGLQTVAAAADPLVRGLFRYVTGRDVATSDVAETG